MSDYLVTDTELTSVANAIRTKGGTSSNLSFPTGFVSAIQAISTGVSGLVYETGTYSPTSNVSSPTISFSDSHSKPPSVVYIANTTNANTANGELCWWGFFNFYRLLGTYTRKNQNSSQYGVVVGLWNSSGSSTFTQIFANLTAESFTEVSVSHSTGYYAFLTGFIPRSNTQTFTLASGKTYKWIAIWK